MKKMLFVSVFAAFGLLACNTQTKPTEQESNNQDSIVQTIENDIQELDSVEQELDSAEVQLNQALEDLD
ncbi:MAG TPA: hypothetical protein PK029_01700 [Bacteroidales bacterium]|nr:hypothetical protein [Bacteroidales bacterium]HPH15856.1 hypothetical protein [Bacteroidales bacterium]